MDLLDWVRGPLLAVALTVFMTGIAWRIVSLLRLPATTFPGTPRAGADAMQQGAAALRRFGIPQWFPASATLVTFNPYVFHVGLFLVFFGYAPHIAFVRRLTGLHWPALPDGVVYIAAAATIVSLCLALLFRLTDPVLRRISNADDVITWAVTMLPLLTGMGVVDEPSARLLAREHVTLSSAAGTAPSFG